MTGMESNSPDDWFTTDQLMDLAERAKIRYPTGRLVKNQLGNLAVLVDGSYVDYLDLHTGHLGSETP